MIRSKCIALVLLFPVTVLKLCAAKPITHQVIGRPMLDSREPPDGGCNCLGMCDITRNKCTALVVFCQHGLRNLCVAE